MILHEERYFEFIQQKGVGKKDRVDEASPKSYVSYLCSVAKLLGREDITPDLLGNEADIENIVSTLKARQCNPGSLRNYKSAMRQYVAMVKELGLAEDKSERRTAEASESECQQALRWVLANRRHDIPLEQAVRLLTTILPRDLVSALELRRLGREVEGRQVPMSKFSSHTAPLERPARE